MDKRWIPQGTLQTLLWQGFTKKWNTSVIIKLFWLVVSIYPSEKYDFVSWDDEIPNWMEKYQKVFPIDTPILVGEFPNWITMNHHYYSQLNGKS